MRTLHSLLTLSLLPAASLAVFGCISGKSNDLPVLRDTPTTPTAPAPEPTVAPAAVEAGVPGLDKLTVTSIDFGNVPCGTTPDAKSIELHNGGSAPLTFDASLHTSSFSLDVASGTIAAGGKQLLTLRARKVDALTTAGAIVEDTLVISTNAPGLAKVSVPVRLVASGATIVLDPAMVGFGQVQLSAAAADVPISLKNAGNVAASVSIVSPSNADFSVTWAGSPGAATVAAGQSLAGLKAGFRPTVAGAKAETLAIQVKGPLCGDSAPSLRISGEGTTAAVRVTPSALDFGTTACGGTAPERTVTITNDYDFAITYQASLSKGTSSPYSLPAATGSVPAHGSADVRVTPLAIPAQANLGSQTYGDTLTLSTTAPGVSPVSVALTQSAVGSIVGVSMPTTDFGTLNPGGSATLPFTVTNSGNQTATVTVAASGAGFSAQLAAPTTVAPNNPRSGTVTFTPTASGRSTGTLTVTPTTALCAPAPAAIALSGAVTGPVASYTSAVAFVAVCGQQAPTDKIVTITNSGAAALTIGSVTTTAPFVVVAAPTGAIAPGQSATITVRAPAAVVGTDRGGTSRTGTLSFQTNEGGTPTRQVGLSVAYNGANLDYLDAQGQVIAPATPVYNYSVAACAATPNPNPWQAYSVRNSGNTDVTVTSLAQISADGSASVSFAGFAPVTTDCYNGCASGRYCSQYRCVPGTGDRSVRAGQTVSGAISATTYMACAVQYGGNPHTTGTGDAVCIPLPALIVSAPFTHGPQTQYCYCPQPQ